MKSMFFLAGEALTIADIAVLASVSTYEVSFIRKYRYYLLLLIL